jgi:hypothetical protein
MRRRLIQINSIYRQKNIDIEIYTADGVTLHSEFERQPAHTLCRVQS